MCKLFHLHCIKLLSLQACFSAHFITTRLPLPAPHLSYFSLYLKHFDESVSDNDTREFLHGNKRHGYHFSPIYHMALWFIMVYGAGNIIKEIMQIVNQVSSSLFIVRVRKLLEKKNQLCSKERRLLCETPALTSVEFML